MAWQSLIMTLAKSCTWQTERVALYKDALRERGAPNPQTKEGSITMTYNEFLSRFCGCHEDEVGNRPCDNGCMCDKCMTPELEKLWKEVRDNA